MGVNQSPTAIVIGLHPPVGADSRIVRLEFLDDDETKSIRRCRLLLDWDLAVEGDVTKIVKRIKQQLSARLAAASEADLDEDESDEDLVATDFADDDLAADDEFEEDEEEEAAEEAEGEEEPGTEEIELGRSLIETLLRKLDDSEWCVENIDALKEMSRPATIIDGQHRIRGASNCERNIPFTICAIYNCPWPEQIFQFTVVNYTAKGIPDQFLVICLGD